MDKVFHEFKQVLNYFEPISYLDIGVCKGHAIPFILDMLPSLKNIEMIEANRLHEPELQILSKEKNIPFYIEVLSDSIKEIEFYLASLDPFSTGPGNSYYKENTPHYTNPIIEKRITNTLDNLYKDKNIFFDLVKIDTQGSELDIIKGGEKLLQNTKAFILEENILGNFNTNAPSHYDIKTYLKDIGYEWICFLDDKQRTIEDINNNIIQFHEVDSLYIKKNILI
jgi:FkbM family methyltransferase